MTGRHSTAGLGRSARSVLDRNTVGEETTGLFLGLIEQTRRAEEAQPLELTLSELATDEFPAVSDTDEFPATTVEQEEEQHTGQHRQRRQLPAHHLLPLLLVLSVQAGLSMRLIWSNTVFQDEALYLWAGRLEWAHWLHGAPLPAGGGALATYFSGAPVIYPPLGALANDVGGLAGARILSLVFMLGATVLLYSVTCRLVDRRAAIIAAGVFAFLGVTQNLGAFATYDAMALFMLALASWFAVRSSGRWGEPALIACAACLVLACATKYSALLWSPVVIALAVLPAPDVWWKSLLHGTRLVLYGAAIALPLLFLVGGQSYVSGLMFTTLTRQIKGSTPALVVLESSYNWIGVLLILALLGFILTLSAGDRRVSWLCGILVAAGLLAPLEQARIDTLTSLQKHVDFGAWFVAIAVGFAASAMTRVNPAKAWRIPVFMFCAVLVFGIPQASTLFTWWPNSSAMTKELSAAIDQSPCPCLIAEGNVARYSLPGQLSAPSDVISSGFEYYGDFTSQKLLTGIPAYQAAIGRGYFGVIEMDGAEDTPVFDVITHALDTSPEYRLVATIPASNQQQPFRIWVKRSPVAVRRLW